MIDIKSLKDKITSTIYPNGKGAINAADHQALLLDFADNVESLSDGQQILNQQRLELVEDSYFGAYGLKVGDKYTSSITSGTGIAANKIAVKEGEIYLLKGRGNPYTYKGWFIVNTNNIVTRIIGDNDEYDVEVTIEEGEDTLYVNCVGYNTSNDGVWKINRTSLKDSVLKLQEAIQSQIIEDNTILNGFIVSGQAYNLGGNKVGDRFTSTPNTSATSAYIRIAIEPNSKYEIRGEGSPYSFRFFAFLDKNLTILELSSGNYNTRDNPLILTPPANAAFIIVNFTNYNSTLDGVIRRDPYQVQDLIKLSKQPLTGMNMVCFGDSITQFDSSIGMRYSDYLALAGANVTNVGIGGTQLRQRMTPAADPTTIDQAYAGLDVVSLVDAVAKKDFAIQEASATFVKNNSAVAFDPEIVISNLKAIDWPNIQIVTFMAGTNDWFNGKNLGEASEEDVSSTLGAMNYIIRALLTAYPHLKIYWLTPIVRYVASSLSDRIDANWGAVKTNTEGKTLLDYVDAIIEVARNNSIPVCDMYRTLGWNKYNFVQYFNDNDGTHPYKGFQEIANRIESFILSNLN